MFWNLEYEDVNPEIANAVFDQLDSRREKSNFRPTWNAVLNLHLGHSALRIRRQKKNQIFACLCHDVASLWSRSIQTLLRGLAEGGQSATCGCWGAICIILERRKDKYYDSLYSPQVVFVIKWSKNTAGRVIFPMPAAHVSQQIVLTKGQLFGANLPARKNPAQSTNLSLDGLRAIAARNIVNDGYTPA
ncbi:hypothetical protein V8E54_010154 [Elaphomyces granulatus]